MGRIIVSLALFAAAIGLAPAHAAEKRILIASFEDLVIDGDMQIVIETGKSPSARATGDRRVLDLLKMDRVGTTLRIRLNAEPNQSRSQPTGEPLRIFITNRQVRDIVLRGNAKLDINAIKQTGASKLNLLGSGEINLGTLNVDKFDANIVGNGKLTVGTGMVRISNVIIEGGAVFDAAGLTSRQLSLTHRGNANSSTSVQESAEIDNSGSGAIRITGAGLCFVREPGQATITCSHRSDKKTRN